MSATKTDAQKIADLQRKIAKVAQDRTDPARRPAVIAALAKLGIVSMWRTCEVTLRVDTDAVSPGMADEDLTESNAAHQVSRWLYDQDRDDLRHALTAIRALPSDQAAVAAVPTTYAEYVALVGDVISNLVADHNWCLDPYYYLHRVTGLDLPVRVSKITGAVRDVDGTVLWELSHVFRMNDTSDALRAWIGEAEGYGNQSIGMTQKHWIRFRDFYGANPIDQTIKDAVTGEDGSVTIAMELPAFEDEPARTVSATLIKTTALYSTFRH